MRVTASRAAHARWQGNALRLLSLAVGLMLVPLMAVGPASARTVGNGQQLYCPPVEVFYAAGSGGSQKPNRVVRDAIEQAVGAENMFGRAVDYPAAGSTIDLAGAGLRIGPLGGYHRSVVRGKKWLSARVKELITGCQAPTKTWIVMLGYSQGAQVVADVFQSLSMAERDRVAGMVLFGDPYFNGLSHGGFGGFDSRNNGVLGKRRRFTSHTHRIRSYCFKRDYICQGDYSSKISNARFIRSKAHSEYHKAAAKQAGEWIGQRIKALRAASAGPMLYLSPSDGDDGGEWNEKRFRNWLAATGLPMDASLLPPSDLSPYRCVLIDGNGGDVDWTHDGGAVAAVNSYALAGGTLVIQGEWGRDANTHRVNGILEAYGVAMRLRGTNVDPLVVQGRAPFFTSAVDVSPLTAGVTGLAYAATDVVDLSPPAMSLVRNGSTGESMVAWQPAGTGRVVLLADTVYQYDGKQTDNSGNRQLIRNLCGPAQSTTAKPA